MTESDLDLDSDSETATFSEQELAVFTGYNNAKE